MKTPDLPSPETSAASIGRRDFMKAVSAAGLGLALGAASTTAQPSSPSGTRRRRYAIVGTGSRHEMYREAIVRRYKDHAELVGLCDLNPGRVDSLAGERQRPASRCPGTPPRTSSR